MSLAAENISFGYGDRRVGSQVTLELGGGEVLCLLGPNGSGKTTLFRTLLGLLRPLSGRVLVDGEDAAGLSRDWIARHVSYVPQAQGTFFPYSVAEVVLMGRTAHLGLFNAPSAGDRAAAAAALRRVGIGHLAEADYTRISGGERQLTLIARALAQESRMMVMDEPTANLDFGNQLRVLEHIRTLADSGIGVLLSTHDPDQALLCADRVAMLHEGRLLACGGTHEVMTVAHLQTLYGVAVSVIEVPLPRGGKRKLCLPLGPC